MVTFNWNYMVNLNWNEVVNIAGISNNVLEAIKVGGGDPTLGSKYFNKEGGQRDFLISWADSIYNFGIREIKGKVVAVMW